MELGQPKGTPGRKPVWDEPVSGVRWTRQPPIGEDGFIGTSPVGAGEKFLYDAGVIPSL